MPKAQIQKALGLLSDPNIYVNRDGVRELEKLVANIPELLLEHYRVSRGWRCRLSCVYFSVPYARSSNAAVKLGIEALNDKSRKVRYRACSLLAYSLRNDVIPALKKLLVHQDSTTVEDARTAIECIEKNNHHLFMDRNRTGRVEWEVEEKHVR